MKRGVALWLLGMITGATLCSIITGSSLEKLYQEKERLKVELFETTSRLYQLEKQLRTRETGQVQEIIIELDTPAGALEQLALRQALAEIASDLIGEKIELLKPGLLVKLFHQRVLAVEGKQYLISVRWIVVGEKITFNLTASFVNQNHNPTDPL